MDNFALVCILLAFIAGFGSAFVWIWQVKRTALSITRTGAGAKGNTARAEQEGELMAMLMEAGEAFKKAKAEGKPMQQAAAEIVPGLVAKYPTVAMKYGKKLFTIFKSGGFEGLAEELF